MDLKNPIVPRVLFQDSFSFPEADILDCCTIDLLISDDKSALIKRLFFEGKVRQNWHTIDTKFRRLYLCKALRIILRLI